ncbi:hypothetical protein ACHAP7_004405 [Fusarium lateritium]
MVTKLPGCTFILDGLDECTGMNSTDLKSVSNFLDQLEKAILNTGTRLLISSRADPIIQQGLSSFPGYAEYTILSSDITKAVLVTEDCQEFPFNEMPDTIDKDYIDSIILDLYGSLIEVRHSPMNEVEQE